MVQYKEQSLQEQIKCQSLANSDRNTATLGLFILTLIELHCIVVSKDMTEYKISISMLLLFSSLQHKAQFMLHKKD